MAPKAHPKTVYADQEKILSFVVKPMSRLNTWLYQASGGRLGGRWTYGAR
jgi:hypothetical protein